MSSLAEIAPDIRVRGVHVDDECLTVDLMDGRSITVPLAWYPRLVQATDEERSTWRLIGRGEGIHWPEVDEDISVEGLIAGERPAKANNRLPSGSAREMNRRRNARPRGRAGGYRITGSSVP